MSLIRKYFCFSFSGTFSTVHRTVKETLVESLVQLLTPKRRIDIIRDVLEAKANKRPYVIAFCGVNGVGKSTNLAKICFWLVENKCSVLIAACDTFRYDVLSFYMKRAEKFKAKKF